MKYEVRECTLVRTTRVWYKNGYADTVVLMATFPWAVWGRQGAWQKAQAFKQTAVVPL